MAGRFGTFAKADIATGTTGKTIMQVTAPTAQGVYINRISISMDGTTNTNVPPKFELFRQTTTGTMTALVAVKKDEAVADALQTVGAHTATAEPTNTDLMDVLRVHPQTGIEKFYSGEERPYIAPGKRLGLLVTATVDVNVSVAIDFEE